MQRRGVVSALDRDRVVVPHTRHLPRSVVYPWAEPSQTGRHRKVRTCQWDNRLAGAPTLYSVQPELGCHHELSDYHSLKSDSIGTQANGHSPL